MIYHSGCSWHHLLGTVSPHISPAERFDNGISRSKTLGNNTYYNFTTFHGPSLDNLGTYTPSSIAETIYHTAGAWNLQPYSLQGRLRHTRKLLRLVVALMIIFHHM